MEGRELKLRFGDRVRLKQSIAESPKEAHQVYLKGRIGIICDFTWYNGMEQKLYEVSIDETQLDVTFPFYEDELEKVED